MGASGLAPIAMVAGISLLMLGALLVKTGFWPRRRGDTPHCRGCGYELTGISNGTCPECGRPWTQSTVVKGKRLRRHGLGSLGVVILILPLAITLIHWINGFDHYRVWPEAWLFKQLDSRDEGSAQLALNELMRRRSAVGLSEAAEVKLTDLAIKEQNRSPQRSFSNTLWQYLITRFEQKKVTDQQAMRLFTPAFHSRLRVRPIVAVGESIPIAIVIAEPGPLRNYASFLELRRLTVGDRRIEEWNTGRRGDPDDGIVEARGFPMPEGEWDVEARCELTIDRNASLRSAFTRSKIPLWSGQITLRSTVKVAATQPAGLVELVNRPQDAEQLRKSISIKDSKFNSITGAFHFTTVLRQPPHNVAFNVFSRCDGREELIFWFTLPKGGKLEQTHWFITRSLPAKVDLIFRASPDLARRTVDLFEVWKNDVVIENIPFEIIGDRPSLSK